MRLLEYESKEILRRYGVQVPKGRVVSSAEGLETSTPALLKAQVPCGGRQKAGAVVEIPAEAEAEPMIKDLLSREVKGYRPTRILAEEKIDIERELFLAIAYDTVAKRPVAVISREGGVEVEQMAVRTPEAVTKEYFSVREGLPQYRAREILSDAGISGKLLLRLGAVLSTLARIFLDLDATLVEVNPLALTPHQELVALDCHMEVDDDALFRHKDLAEKGDDLSRYEGGRRATEFERVAAQIDQLDHRGVAGRVIEFDGTLGLIIGGGGASLTAFDAVRQHGGRPANYCEIGGNPSVRKLTELAKHILSKPGVEKIAVIMNVVSNTRVDMVARGVVKGILEAGRDPSETVAVFRVPGAWEEEGVKILTKYGIPYSDRTVSIDEAARLAVERAKA